MWIVTREMKLLFPLLFLSPSFARLYDWTKEVNLFPTQRFGQNVSQEKALNLLSLNFFRLYDIFYKLIFDMIWYLRTLINFAYRKIAGLLVRQVVGIAGSLGKSQLGDFNLSDFLSTIFILIHPTGTSSNWHFPQLALFANFFGAFENLSPPTAGRPRSQLCTKYDADRYFSNKSKKKFWFLKMNIFTKYIHYA